MEDLNKKMNFADRVASRSKDKSTKVGAVFTDEDGTHPISFGYNGMPRGLDDTNISRNERPEKYIWYEHAERNAIYNAARPILQDKIIFVSHFPNMESARGIVSSGIKEVITDFATYNEADPMTQRVVQLFIETKVNLEVVDFKNHPATFEDFILSHNIKSSEKHIDNYKKVYSKIDKMAYYLGLAKEYGEAESISPLHKNGSLIMDKEYYNPIAAGVYGPPANLKVTQELMENEALFFQEDVKNAIFNAVRSKLKNSVADVTWCPCQRCALAIVAVGSKKVRTRKPDFTKENDLRWQAEFEKSQTIFKYANTEVELLEVPNLEEYKKPKGGLKS